MKPANAIEGYLARYAEDEVLLAGTIATRHDHVLTVPVYDEGDSFLSLLASLEPYPAGSGTGEVHGSALVIAVVNAREDSTPSVMEANKRLLLRLRETYPLVEPLVNHVVKDVAKHPGTGAWLHRTPFGELLCIDRSSRAPLPSKQGVGLARKIALDVALALRAEGKIASRWIHLSDADAVLPPDYFSRTNRLADRTVAATYPFRHRSPDPSLALAGTLHEMFLRHHVVCLQSAGSPYAYHSIGSTIAVDATAYAGVRGVPRRHGAEDFYLLNKLAKQGRIERLGGSPIWLEARPSRRVPFGTGPAILRALESGEPPRLFCHPQSYRYLAALLASFEAALTAPSPADWLAPLNQEGTRRRLDPELLCEMADFLDLESMLRESAARSAKASVRIRDIHTRFDALRSLQLLHWLRDRAFPSQDWRKAMASLGLDGEGDAAAVLAQLIALEERLCGESRGLGD